MPSKRDVLARFSRQELQELAARLQLEVADRRSKDGLVAAASSSRKVQLALVLGDLPRERLKDICRELALDESGKEKAVLIQRLIGAGAGPSVPMKANGKVAEQLKIAVGES